MCLVRGDSDSLSCVGLFVFVDSLVLGSGFIVRVASSDLIVDVWFTCYLVTNCRLLRFFFYFGVLGLY